MKKKEPISEAEASATLLDLLANDIERHPEKLVHIPNDETLEAMHGDVTDDNYSSSEELWDDFFSEEPCPDFPERAEQVESSKPRYTLDDLLDGIEPEAFTQDSTLKEWETMEPVGEEILPADGSADSVDE